MVYITIVMDVRLYFHNMSTLGCIKFVEIGVLKQPVDAHQYIPVVGNIRVPFVEVRILVIHHDVLY